MKTQSTYYERTQMFQGSATEVMGTRLDVVLVGLPERKSYTVWADITREVSRLDKIFNRFDPQSEVSVLNASKVDIETSVDFKDALNLCESYLILTKGLFDITRGGNDDLDFGGFAKGYALRKISVILKAAKVKNAFINFGNSSIMGIGKHPYGDCWKVTLEDPYTEDEIEEFSLYDECLSTSGNTPEYTGHIINPFTKQADTSRKLSCVKAKDPLDAEILSTVLLIANAKQKEEIGYNFKNIENKIFEL